MTLTARRMSGSLHYSNPRNIFTSLIQGATVTGELKDLCSKKAKGPFSLLYFTSDKHLQTQRLHNTENRIQRHKAGEIASLQLDIIVYNSFNTKTF